MGDSLLPIFVFVDDFCKVLSKHPSRLALLPKPKGSRNRKSSLSESEILTIILYFHLSGFKCFKKYYIFMLKYHKKEFPKLVSYTRFIELKQKIWFHLLSFVCIVSAECTGTSYIDSTCIPICHIKRESINKVFKGIAKKGKSTMGWFFGFKLHMIVNDFGHPISFDLTTANCDDRKVSDNFFSKIFGTLFGDKGYIGKPFFDRMKDKMIHVVTAIKKNMKPKMMTIEESDKLKKRSIIESCFNVIKRVFNGDHTRHRSPKNFAINLVSCIGAYCLRFVTVLVSTSEDLLLVP